MPPASTMRPLRFAGVLKCLARPAPNVGNREAIAEAGAIPHLVQMVADEHSSARAQLNAAAALWNICQHVPSKALAINAGAIPALVQMLGSSRDVALRTAILGGLGNMSKVDKARSEVAAAGGIPLLLDILSTGDAALHERAGERWC
jgi:hypothetical protein